jgi:predicted Rossmann fold nucleotide-binding protein DprA/Smf involved in DNA uptake
LDDLLEELSIQTGNGQNAGAHSAVLTKRWESAEELSDDEVKLCKSLSGKSLHIDHLAEKMETEPFKLSPLLLELEMKGLIQQKAGKYFELK